MKDPPYPQFFHNKTSRVGKEGEVELKGSFSGGWRLLLVTGVEEPECLNASSPTRKKNYTQKSYGLQRPKKKAKELLSFFRRYTLILTEIAAITNVIFDRNCQNFFLQNKVRHRMNNETYDQKK